MRRTLATAVALAPLCFAAQAMAATTITGTRTTPVATATGNGTSPDDVVIGVGAVLQPASGATPAALVNSNNTLTNQGSITYNDVDNAVGVQLQGGVTGSLDNQGAITFTESYSATDSNVDGVVEGPVAKGTNRTGILVTGGTFTGQISSSGSVSVQGNNSYGIRIESPLNGSLLLSGSGVSVIGNNSVGISVAAPVSGELRMLGAINAVGENARAVEVTGDVAGRISFYGAVTATGFTNTTRITDPLVLARIQGVPGQVQRGGAAVTIGANVGGGVLIGAPPSTTTTDTTGDFDGDGLPDNSVGTGLITSYGDAPALLIGKAGGAISLGNVGTGDMAYGLVVRGTVTANGVYDGFSTTAVQIGLPGGTVNMGGGIRFFGGASSTAYQANAYGVRIGAGVIAPVILNEGGVSGSVTTSTNHSAYAILIDAGAQLGTLTNTGIIAAGELGDGGSSYAVVDRSGTLSTVNNLGGVISAATQVSTAGATPTGARVALDLSANTTGVTLTQTGTAALISGAVLLGNGPNTVDLQGGLLNGRLALGSGAAVLNISGGARYQGALSHTGPNLAINVSNGVLQNDSSATFQATSLNVGATSSLIFAVDPATSTATRYTVSGAATFANGAKLGLRVLSPVQGSQTYTVVSAGSLSVGATDLTQTVDLPFLFAANFRPNVAAGTISLDVRRRTAAELGFNRSETQGFEAIYAGIGADPVVQNALFSQTTQAGVKMVYDQLLPDYAGGMFRAGQIASEAVSRAAADPEDFVNASGGRGLWAEEIYFGVKQDRGDAAAYNIGGFGFAGGMEMGGRGFGAVGVSTSFTTAQIRNPDLNGDNHHSFSNFEVGLYWRAQWAGFRADVRAAGGYGWFQSGRQVLAPGATADALPLVDKRNKANWSGYTASARAGLGYEARLGALFVRPQVHADYFRLSEGARTEKFGGDVLNLIIDKRTGDAVSGTASLVTGAVFGSSMRWKPSVELGWRDTITGGAGDTTFRIANGPSATLSPGDLKGGGAIARVAVKADTDFFEVGLEAGGQANSQTRIGDVKLTARIVF
jgi:outer membrane autotransporter protein